MTESLDVSCEITVPHSGTWAVTARWALVGYRGQIIGLDIRSLDGRGEIDQRVMRGVLITRVRELTQPIWAAHRALAKDLK